MNKNIKVMVAPFIDEPKEKEYDIMDKMEKRYTKKFNQQVIVIPHDSEIFDMYIEDDLCKEDE